ncbi:TraV family lipoprotein [Pseudoalteromonas sp.]|uniref:TraV family lipoprotein n=1 Tax=Pseudoalteromonas sp. TaxID=53249 RepID=UPI00262912DE|nr:TraV family lipoprotein [Pseudoalteromonas sp.]MCP4589086.1 TraV family lipoprotein [Pseudoalteromonas sp.]
MKRISLLIFPTAALLIQGCVASIGKEDFACPNEKKGGVCAGPRSIYELTNTRENLEDISDDENYEGYYITTNEDGETIAVKAEKRAGTLDVHDVSPTQYLASRVSATQYVYEPRDHQQQTPGNYQTATPLPPLRVNPTEVRDGYQQWPSTMEPLAPEPLSVLEPPKVMRILVNSYKDDVGNLVMPGYMYVQVEAETWSFGEAATLRPQRVVPLDIREKATQEESRQRYSGQGVSSLGHTESNQ